MAEEIIDLTNVKPVSLARLYICSYILFLSRLDSKAPSLHSSASHVFDYSCINVAATRQLRNHFSIIEMQQSTPSQCLNTADLSSLAQPQVNVLRLVSRLVNSLPRV